MCEEFEIGLREHFFSKKDCLSTILIEIKGKIMKLSIKTTKILSIPRYIFTKKSIIRPIVIHIDPPPA